jgi:hypothetical protein
MGADGGDGEAAARLRAFTPGSEGMHAPQGRAAANDRYTSLMLIGILRARRLVMV